MLQFDGCLEIANGEDPGISFFIETKQNQLQVVFPDWKTAWQARSLANLFQLFKRIPIPADPRLDTTILLMVAGRQRGEMIVRGGAVIVKPFYLRWIL
ncbi:MAG: hypothetical protein AAF571_05270 [Verrucomicrobiota bacterium]